MCFATNQGVSIYSVALQGLVSGCIALVFEFLGSCTILVSVLWGCFCPPFFVAIFLSWPALVFYRAGAKVVALVEIPKIRPRPWPAIVRSRLRAGWQ